jgi:hypothetical protein
MNSTPEYKAFVERLIAALTTAGATFRALDPDTDDIGGVVEYDEGRDGLIYDILVIPDEQNPSAGRYLFRHVDSHPQHVPSFELRSDDVDAVINAMRARQLLPTTTA